MQIIHFAVYLFGGLVCFAVCWLYLDAWKQSRARYDAVRIIGLGLLACSYVVSALHIDSTVFSGLSYGVLSFAHFSAGLRMIGAALYIISLAMEPLVDRPDATQSVVASSSVTTVVPVVVTGISPLLLAGIGLLYLRRSTVGLERHVRPVAWSFFVLSIADLISLRSLFVATNNSLLYGWVISYGPLWMAEHIAVSIGMLLLGKWVVGYLFKQFQTQLFMIFTLANLFLFIITTLSFTGLLLMNMEKDALDQISTDAKVLSFTLQSQKSQLVSDAELYAKNSVLIEALERNDLSTGKRIATDMIMAKHISSLLIVSDSGKVFARAEDNERIGDSLSDDSLVKRALLGSAVSSVVSVSGALAPTLMFRAAVPVKDATGNIIGAVITGNAIDTAFVDGLKRATGLDVSVYGGDTVSATSFLHGTTNTRAIGRKEWNTTVRTQVLEKGRLYAGSVIIENERFIGAYAPLSDIDTNVVGMVFVGRPEIAIFDAAGRSIQYTCIIAVLLLVASVFPAYRLARYMSDQL